MSEPMKPPVEWMAEVLRAHNTVCEVSRGHAFFDEVADALIELSSKLESDRMYIQDLTALRDDLESRLGELTKENERLKNMAAGMFWSGGNFDEKTSGEVVALGLDVRSRLDAALEIMRMVQVDYGRGLDEVAGLALVERIDRWMGGVVENQRTIK